MKSPIVQNTDPNPTEGTYTELQVLCSGGGWYIGTMFQHHNDNRSQTPGLLEPGSRDSGYYETKEAAEFALKHQTWIQRQNP